MDALSVVVLPLALGVLIWIPGARMASLRWAAWAPLPALLLSLTAPQALVRDFPWLLLGTRLGLDDSGRLFLFFAALVWLIAGLYARAYLRDDPRRHVFWAFFLATQSGSLGLNLALDPVSFYTFFSLMTFAAYGLVIHAGTVAARRAGRVYLTMAVFGEALLFVGLVLGVHAADTTALPELRAAVAASPALDVYVALILAGFGIKAGALLLHMWLPLAHPVAPTPASAVLSGVMIKAGILGWIRFLPLGEATLVGHGMLLVVAGVAAVFYGVAIGLTQDNPKTVLAYSSISQMGFLTLGIGAGLAVPAAWPALLGAVSIYALHHALAKSALFLGVGVAASGTATRAEAIWIFAGLLLPALALAGLPWTSGALAKWLLKDALETAVLPSIGWLWWALPLAALGTTLLMGRFLFLMWRTLGKPAPHPQAGYGADKGLLFPYTFSLTAVVVVTWGTLGDQAARFVQIGFSPDALWSGFWPLAAGTAIVLCAWCRAPAWLRRTPAVPAGDMLCWATVALRAAHRLARRGKGLIARAFGQKK